VDVRLEEAFRIDNQIDMFGKAFLGLTIACARCHDHKFDAISTEDYYALAGFLQSSRRRMRVAGSRSPAGTAAGGDPSPPTNGRHGPQQYAQALDFGCACTVRNSRHR
jgi:hypothetical protein